MIQQDKAFYGGLVTALIVVNFFDQPVIYDEIVGTLGEKELRGLFQFVEENGELELSGMSKYKSRRGTNENY